jgi:hypothetical protein
MYGEYKNNDQISPLGAQDRDSVRFLVVAFDVECKQYVLERPM